MWIFLLAGCDPRPARLFSPECEPRCLREVDVRVHSNDALVTAPLIWKFYDDFAARLPPACTPDGGPSESGLRPLWRRAIIPIEANPEYGPLSASISGHSAIDFHPDGGLAVAVGGVLWILDPQTGEPRHILKAGDERHLPSGYTPFDTPVVAFTPDGHLWTAAQGPVLLNLERFDRLAGPYVEYSWHGAHAGEVFLDGWSYPSKSVGRDGTLFWRDRSGITRALEPSGRVRWERSGLEGFPTLDGNDNTWWSGSGVGLRADDGGIFWVPELLPTWSANFPSLPGLETQPVGNLIAARHKPMQGVPLLGLHRIDGSLAGVIPEPAATVTAMGDRTIYIWRASTPGGTLSAWDTGTFQMRWSLPVAQPVSVGPIVSARNNSVWVSTADCRISEVSSNGTVTRWHQMAGEPSGMAPYLADGILFVLSKTHTGLPAEASLLPGGPQTQPDAGYGTPADYGCLEGRGRLCGRSITAGTLFFLTAYRVE